MNRRSFFTLFGATFLAPFLPKKTEPKPAIHTLGYLQPAGILGPTGATGPPGDPGHMITDPGHQHAVYWQNIYQNEGLNRSQTQWQNQSI